MAIHTFIKIQLHYPSYFLHSFPIPFLKFFTKTKVGHSQNQAKKLIDMKEKKKKKPCTSHIY